MSEQNRDAIFYPEKGKILINAQFYTFWISPEEFKKYNLEYSTLKPTTTITKT